MASASNNEDIVELAKRHLDFPRCVQDEATLHAYVDELKFHLALSPGDTNFHLKPEPRVGYGRVVCLESACNNAVIHLHPKAGGRVIGIGSLASYRVHVESSDAHRESRDQRLQVQTPARKRPAKGRRSLSPDKRQAIYDLFRPPPSPVASGAIPFKPASGRRSITSADSSSSADEREVYALLTDDVSHGPVTPLRVQAPLSPLPTGPFVPNSWDDDDSDSDMEIDRLPGPPLLSLGNARPRAEATFASTSFAYMDVDSDSEPTGTSQAQPAASGSRVTLDMQPRHMSMAEELSYPTPEPSPQRQRTRTTAVGLVQTPRRVLTAGAAGASPSPRSRFGRIVAHLQREHALEVTSSDEFTDSCGTLPEALQGLQLLTVDQWLEGMTMPLMPHQIVGVAWMLRQELEGPRKGGLLADEMGLGKTIMMIALMVRHRPMEWQNRPTLVVSPLAVLKQWRDEIVRMTTPPLKVHIYHGLGKGLSLRKLATFDVVLTTYGTMFWELPEEWANPLDKPPGPLFEVEWGRVVLDEAQIIRNFKTATSRIAAQFKAEFRWCLTGTPIINTLADAYGMLRFLRFQPWCHWAAFEDRVMKHEQSDPKLAAAHLREILTDVCIRRKKTSLMNGKPLITLPPKNVEIVRLEFSEDERDVYEKIECRCQNDFKRYREQGVVFKYYLHVLTMLLRLRQLCSHRALIEEDGVAYSTQLGMIGESVNRFEVQQRARKVLHNGAEFVEGIRTRYLQLASKRSQNALVGDEALDAVNDGEEDICKICMNRLTRPVVTACKHVFCKVCIVVIADAHVPSEGICAAAKASPPSVKCPTCSDRFLLNEIFAREAFEPTKQEIKAGKLLVVKRPRQQACSYGIDPEWDSEPWRRYEDEEGGGLDDDLSDFIVQSDEDEAAKDERREAKRRRTIVKGKRAVRPIILDSDEEEEEVQTVAAAPTRPMQRRVPPPATRRSIHPPSAKMKAMMELLQKWTEENPDEKILVISQWTQYLKLVSDYLEDNGLLHVRYQGDMEIDEREKAIRLLMSGETAPIMLLSLKCGGVGLNLTRANRVINLDLGWSLAVEHQAFDRVHRVGQTRPVHVRRLVIKDTIEDRILELQERKQLLADGSLGERHGGTGPGRLTEADLARLFGVSA